MMMEGEESDERPTNCEDAEHDDKEDDTTELRVFRVVIHLRSFKASMMLPRRSVNAFVRLLLPSQIVQLAVASSQASSKLTTPLRTHPPVPVDRGTEVNIPNGYVALELPASAHAMAAMLKLQPQVIAHVLHSDKYEADVELGVAYLPMVELMERQMLDSYTTVLGASDHGRPEKANIGAVRVQMAIKELGPLDHFEKIRVLRVGGPFHQDKQTSLYGLSLRKPNVDTLNGAQGTITPTEFKHFPTDKSNKDSGEHVYQSETMRVASTQTSSPASQKVETSPPKSNLEEYRKHPQYAMAWEFEMWRRAEESKWQAEMKEKEAVRMGMLEEEWKKREKQHALQLQRAHAEQGGLESKLWAKLFMLEKRERAIVYAEEEYSHRKEALEKESANRKLEAQVAVKRLKADCEHQVELEHIKYTTLEAQHAALKQRLSVVNSSLFTLEKQFLEFKAAQRCTSEAELVAEIIALKQQCTDLETKTAKALRARNDYKAQVLRMAKELARIHGQLKDAEMRRLVQKQEQLESEFAAAPKVQSCIGQNKLLLQHLNEQLDLQPCEMDAMQIGSKSSVEEGIVAGLKYGRESVAGHKNSRVGNKVVQGHSGDAQVFKNSNVLPLSNEKPGSEIRLKHNTGLLKSCLVQHSESIGKQLTNLQNQNVNEIDNAAKWYDPQPPELMSTTDSISRLSLQRTELLQTGVYNEHDHIIRGLELEIQRLQSGISSHERSGA